MMWHVEIGGVKHEFYTMSLYNVISYIYIYILIRGESYPLIQQQPKKKTSLIQQTNKK